MKKNEMSTTENNSTIYRGLKLRSLNIIIMTVSAIFSFLMAYFGYNVLRDYRSLQQTVSVFRISQVSGTQVRTASDFLSQQTKSFVTTGAKRYMDNYFEEIEFTRRRENAIEEIKTVAINPIAEGNLEAAISYSHDLEEFEKEAFLLALDAYGFQREDYPDVLKNQELDERDQALNREGKLARAKELITSNTYETYRNFVTSSTDSAITVMTRTIEDRYEEIGNNLNRNVISLIILTFLTLMTILIAFLTVSLRVIKPLNKMINDINEQNELQMKGVYEMRYLANTYNLMRDKILNSQEQAIHEATHDALTGIYNRKAYSDIYNRVENEKICYILVDVDDFKKINDTYGHDAGDMVLQSIATILNESFRSDDKAFRIGGDEFAVIMFNAGVDIRHIVEQRIATVIDKVKQSKNKGLPDFTLSIGVAFGKDEKSTGKVYKDADLALYEAKKGKNRVVFYRDIA